MRKTRPPIVPSSWTGSLLLCALLISGCQPDPASSTELIASESPGEPSGLLTDGSTAFLSADALTAPEQPDLRIRSEAATLILDWSPIAEQTVARLYHHDSALPGETLVYESDDSQQHLLHLPSATPQTAWHREQYRLELCTADNCLSSERMTLSGLAPATTQYLSPAVFVQGERYAEHLALNRDASLAVISMPLEGSLEFHLRSARQWTLSQRLRLDALPDAAARSLLLSSSALGNTVAVFVKNTDSPDQNEIRILERLGETWLQTTALPLTTVESGTSGNALTENQNTNEIIEQDHSLLISADGNGLLLQSAERLYFSQRSESGWSSLQLLPDMSNNTITSPESPSRLTSMSSNGDFTRILALVQHDGSIYLNLWSIEQETGVWQPLDQLPLSGFSQDHELALQTNAQGNEILIAGWEAGNRSERYPIMWHYAIETDSSSQSPASGMVLQALDSLRAPPTTQAKATLIFNASETLTQALLGWRTPEDSASGTLPDAAVSTWKYHEHAGQWLSSLELPEAIPTLAKQAFANGMVLSGDGSTLMVPITARSTQTTGLGIGEVLVLR